jgi:hypothetical protein
MRSDHRTTCVTSLGEAAVELWRTDWLREMSGESAAELWLKPILTEH